MKKIVLGAAFAALSLGLPGAAQAQRVPAAVVVVVDTDRAANRRLHDTLHAAVAASLDRP